MDDWYSVYIVECRDGSFYTGIAKDVERRVREHNTSKRGARYTRTRRPVRLVWNSLRTELPHAMKVERHIKRMSRKQKLKYIGRL